jgi:cobalt-zinc-cadmium efflux system membrane fusion protein
MIRNPTLRPILKLALCATVLVLTSGCGRDSESAEAKNSSLPQVPAGEVVIPPDSPQLSQIRVAAVESASVPLAGVSAPGKVEASANRLSHVVLPMTGRITSVSVHLGDFVRQGQPLLTIEGPDADAAVSNLLQSQAAVTNAKSVEAKAQLDLDRAKDLLQHGAVPQKEVLNAEAVKIQAHAAVEQAEAAVEQARRRLELFGITPGSFGQRVTVRAPISGKVLELTAVNGEFRNDLSAPLITIADLSSVWVTSDVPETAIRLVKVGEPVHIELTAYPGESFRGRVTLIGDVVDPQTRTVKVRAVLPNPDGRLKPEMFGNVQLAEHSELVPTVPAAAVIAGDGKSVVWRETRPGTFQKTVVTTGAQVGDRVAILSGLKPGDRVVVDGVMLLQAN